MDAAKALSLQISLISKQPKSEERYCDSAVT